MFFVVKRSTLLFCLFLSLSVIFGVFLVGFSKDSSSPVIVIDAGHGEPDGGAVASDGTIESSLNLDISKKLSSLLSEENIKVVMTREDEKGIYDSSLEEKSTKEKKKNDMYKRLEIKNSSDADMFISIHMNKFEVEKYKGAQVIYDKTNEQAKLLSEHIQKALNEFDKENTRQPMAADGSIFLLKSSSVPSVIVECGFLSNNEEREKLKTESYRNDIANAIAAGILEYLKTTQ